MMWIAFAGGSWLWEGGKPDELLLGDMVGPFGSWTAASEWALREFPLSGTPAEQRETLAELVRWVDEPAAWSAVVSLDIAGSAPVLGQMLQAAADDLQLRQVTLDAEMDVFWAARS
jgi:hypothetical protein